MVVAWARRNFVQPGPSRRGVGPIPALLRMSRIVVTGRSRPSFRSSPLIRMYPHLGFSLAMRITRFLRWGAVGGRPGLVLPHRRAFAVTSWRCHLTRVSGLTRKDRQRQRGSKRLRVASSILSCVRTVACSAVGAEPRAGDGDDDLDILVVDSPHCAGEQSEQRAIDQIGERDQLATSWSTGRKREPR
jgi:hypothetical protein